MVKLSHRFNVVYDFAWQPLEHWLDDEMVQLVITHQDLIISVYI